MPVVRRVGELGADVRDRQVETRFERVDVARGLGEDQVALQSGEGAEGELVDVGPGTQFPALLHAAQPVSDGCLPAGEPAGRRDAGGLVGLGQLAGQGTQRAAGTWRDAAGDVDILVDNAASLPTRLTVDQDVPWFRNMLDTNVRGSFFLTAGLVAGMLTRGRGSIVNVSTMAASMGVAEASGYSATEAALEWGERVEELRQGPAAGTHGTTQRDRRGQSASSPHPARATSPVQRCRSTAAAPPSDR
jgi:NAD(P)-dependent dehydrogenase (short-subunit alcohol dehydrogenase family)